jgi:hypothetical protein
MEGLVEAIAFLDALENIRKSFVLARNFTTFPLSSSPQTGH